MTINIGERRGAEKPTRHTPGCLSGLSIIDSYEEDNNERIKNLICNNGDEYRLRSG
jgi:hypothetical protein